MKTSKILLTSLLAAAAMSTVPAWAVTSTTTELDGVTYSGTIWTTNVSGVTSGKSIAADARTFTSGELSYTGKQKIDVVGYFFNYFFNQSESTYVGNTLHLTGATADHTVYTDWQNYVWLGGLITDACDYTYTIGRSDTSLRLKGTAGVNMNINANTVIWGDRSNISVESGGSWVIANGKTLTLQSNKTVAFATGTTTTVSGGGTLKFAGTVSNAGTLKLSDVNVALTSAITNTGTVNVDTNTVFVLADALKNDSTYTVISTGGAITGWDSLTMENFRQSDGSKFGRSTIDVSTTAGAVTITAGGSASLTWNGGSAGETWDVQTSKNWLNGGASDEFYNGDNVTFDTADANVTVSGTVKPGTMTVSAATTLSGTGTVSVTSGLTLDADLTLDSGVTLSAGTLGSAGALYDATHVKGTGTFGFSAVASGNGSGINLSNFSGEVYLKGGLLELGDASFTSSLGSGALRVASGAHLVFNGTGTNVSVDEEWGGNADN